ncbi:hypothetical protein FRC01_011337, partial [Tulasnella sp. 417]
MKQAETTASNSKHASMSVLGEQGMETEPNEENRPMDDADETGDDFEAEDLHQPVVGKVRRWFILLTQWHHVLAELESYLPHVCRDLAAPLEIRALRASRIPDPDQQAGLFETLEFINPNIDLREKVTAIKSAIPDKTTTNSRALKVLRGLKDDVLEDPKEWREAFTGEVHCEAQLYQGLKEIG